MPASLLRSIRLFLLRWHRRLGVAVSLLLIWLAVTGIVLNHAADWELDKHAGPSVLQGFYRGDNMQFTSYWAGDAWVSHNGASTLYVNGREVGYCAAPFAGAVVLKGEIIAACGEALLLATPGGQLIESVDILYDLGSMPSAVAVADETLLLRNAEGIYQVDLERFEFNPMASLPKGLNWAEAGEHGAALQALLEQASYGNGVSWTQMLADLHSGRIVGRLGTLGMDLVGLLLILLAASGVWVWTTKPGRFRGKR